MLHVGLDLSRRRVDVCLISSKGELVDRMRAPSDTEGLYGLAFSQQSPCAGSPDPRAEPGQGLRRAFSCHGPRTRKLRRSGAFVSSG
jgi:hypothetical protein